MPVVELMVSSFTSKVLSKLLIHHVNIPDKLHIPGESERPSTSKQYCLVASHNQRKGKEEAVYKCNKSINLFIYFMHSFFILKMTIY